MVKFNRRASILISSYMVMLVLLLLGGTFFSRTLSEKRFSDINSENLEAFYLAEAGVDATIDELNSNFSYSGTSPVTLGKGEFETTVTALSSTRREILATGFIPNKAQKRAECNLEVIIKRESPPDFFDKAIYSADEVDLNGNSYSVVGDVIYANTLSNGGNITGTVTQDASISPLVALDFNVLRSIAVTQGNLYDADRLDNVKKGWDTYPTDFWYSSMTDPTDPATGTPNVVYVEGDMVLNGNIGTVGGFFLVVGNVLTDPNDTSDTTINGNGEVDGCIYTTGKFRVNGGGGGLNVDGGVWAGTEAELNGNATVAWNQTFMYSVKSLIESSGSGSKVQVVSWRQL